MVKQQTISQQAEIGERMIQISVRFWTNNIAQGKGKVIPRHAWAGGMVRMEANKTHGIKPKSPKPFNSLLDLTSTIEKVLIEHGIKLVPSDRMKKYLQ